MAHLCDESVDSELEWVVDEDERQALLRRAFAGRMDMEAQPIVDRAATGGNPSRQGATVGAPPPQLNQARLSRLFSGLSSIPTTNLSPTQASEVTNSQDGKNNDSSAHTRHQPFQRGEIGHQQQWGSDSVRSVMLTDTWVFDPSSSHSHSIPNMPRAAATPSRQQSISINHHQPPQNLNGKPPLQPASKLTSITPSADPAKLQMMISELRVALRANELHAERSAAQAEQLQAVLHDSGGEAKQLAEFITQIARRWGERSTPEVQQSLHELRSWAEAVALRMNQAVTEVAELEAPLRNGAVATERWAVTEAEKEELKRLADEAAQGRLLAAARARQVGQLEEKVRGLEGELSRSHNRFQSCDTAAAGEIKALSAKLQRAEERKEAASEEISNARQSIAQLQKRCEEAEGRAAAKQKAVEEVVAQNEWLETQLREANEADVAREARRYGQELARVRDDGAREKAALEGRVAEESRLRRGLEEELRSWREGMGRQAEKKARKEAEEAREAHAELQSRLTREEERQRELVQELAALRAENRMLIEELQSSSREAVQERREESGLANVLGMEDSDEEEGTGGSGREVPTMCVGVQTDEERGQVVRDRLLAAAKEEIVKLREVNKKLLSSQGASEADLAAMWAKCEREVTKQADALSARANSRLASLQTAVARLQARLNDAMKQAAGANSLKAELNAAKEEVAALRRELDEQKVQFQAELRTVMQNGEADAAVASMEAFSHASQAAEARLQALRKELTGKLEESTLEAEALRRALAEARKKGERKPANVQSAASQTTQVDTRAVACVTDLSNIEDGYGCGQQGRERSSSERALATSAGDDSAQSFRACGTSTVPLGVDQGCQTEDALDTTTATQHKRCEEGRSAGCQVEMVRSAAWADIDSWLNDQVQAPSPATSTRPELEGELLASKAEANPLCASQSLPKAVPLPIHVDSSKGKPSVAVGKENQEPQRGTRGGYSGRPKESASSWYRSSLQPLQQSRHHHPPHLRGATGLNRGGNDSEGESEGDLCCVLGTPGSSPSLPELQSSAEPLSKGVAGQHPTQISRGRYRGNDAGGTARPPSRQARPHGGGTEAAKETAQCRPRPDEEGVGGATRNYPGHRVRDAASRKQRSHASMQSVKRIQFPGKDEIADILRASQMHMAKSRQQEDAARKAVATALGSGGAGGRGAEEPAAVGVVPVPVPVITIPTSVPVMAHTAGADEDDRPLSRCKNRYKPSFPPLD